MDELTTTDIECPADCVGHYASEPHNVQRERLILAMCEAAGGTNWRAFDASLPETMRFVADAAIAVVADELQNHIHPDAVCDKFAAPRIYWRA